MTDALTGRLEFFALRELLSVLQKMAATGTLRVTSAVEGSKSIEVLFADGRVSGLKRGGQAIGASRLTDAMCDVLQFNAGVFAFEPLKNSTTPALGSVDVQGLLMESVRRTGGEVNLSQLFSRRTAVYRTTVNPESLRDSAALTLEEWQVLSLLDGRRTLTALCAVVGNPDENRTLEIVRRLLAMDFVKELAQPSEELVKVNPVTMQFSRPSMQALQTPPGEFAASPSSRPGDEPMKATKSAVTSWRLLVYEGKSEDAWLVPVTKDVTTIGRHLSNDVVFPANAVSGFHARIDRKDGHLEVIDLKSRNGTLLNGLPLEGSQRLKEGDELTVRPFRILVSVDRPAQGATVALPTL